MRSFKEKKMIDEFIKNWKNDKIIVITPLIIISIHLFMIVLASLGIKFLISDFYNAIYPSWTGIFFALVIPIILLLLIISSFIILIKRIIKHESFIIILIGLLMQIIAFVIQYIYIRFFTTVRM